MRLAPGEACGSAGWSPRGALLLVSEAMNVGDDLQDLVLGDAAFGERPHGTGGTRVDDLELAHVRVGALVDYMSSMRLGPMPPEPSGMWQAWQLSSNSALPAAMASALPT